MSTIHKKIRDNVLHISTSSEMNPYKFTYPVTWEGFINSNKIKIIQVDSVTFEFEGIREEDSYLKNDIKEEINISLDEKLS